MLRLRCVQLDHGEGDLDRKHRIDERCEAIRFVFGAVERNHSFPGSEHLEAGRARGRRKRPIDFGEV